MEDRFLPEQERAELHGLDKPQLIERLQAEMGRRQRLEARLEQVVTHLDNCQRIAHVGSWEIDLTPAGTLAAPLFWSKETFKILGLDRATHQPTLESFMNTVHPDDRKDVMDSTEEAIKAGRQSDIECRVVLPDGTKKIVRGISEIALDDTGRPVKIVGVSQDITEKKKAVAQLQDAHKELKTLFESIDEVLFSVEVAPRVLLQISAACEKVYGYTVQEFYSSPNLWFDVILEEDRPVIYASDKQLERGESALQLYRIHHKNGEIRWLQSKLEPKLDKAGKLVRLDGITSDVTKRMEAEIALKNSESRLRSLIENLTDGIAITNLNQKIVFASQSLTRITGYNAEEISEINIYNLIHPDDEPVLQSSRRQLLEAPGGTATFTIRWQRKDGEWIWIEGISQNCLGDPAIQGVVTNYRDITERIQYEEALRQSNEHLKKSNSELDRFVYSVSHDLRAPLASILGVIAYSEAEASSPEMLENLALMKASAKKLDSFILDILEYSRNIRTEVKNDEIDFKELLQDVTSNLKFMGTGNSDVDIRINIQSEGSFYSDRNRVAAVLNNLVSNAIRYCNPEAEQPFVDIDVMQKDQGAEITVADNGIGIDPKYHDKVFNMFFRVSRKSVGSGLGLYIVREAVERLQGTLQFESEPDKGTKFMISLPSLKINEQT